MPKLISGGTFSCLPSPFSAFPCLRRVRQTAPLRSKGGPRGVGGKRSILKGHRVDATPEREAEPVPASVWEQATPPPVSMEDPHRHRSCERSLREIHTADTCDWPPMSLPLDVSHPDHGSSKGANFARVDPPQCNAAPPCTQDGIRFRMELCPEELEFLAAFRGVG